MKLNEIPNVGALDLLNLVLEDDTIIFSNFTWMIIHLWKEDHRGYHMRVVKILE